MLKSIVVVFSLFVVLSSCKEKKTDQAVQQATDKTPLKYATGFRVSSAANHSKLVEVISPYQGANTGFTYLLVPDGEEVPAHASDVRVIRTPVKSIVCTSTTHIPMLDYLESSELLVGFPTLDFISSKTMRARINAGKITELGTDKGMNLELVAALKPELVMGYTMSADYGQFGKIEDFGIPVFINAEYLEKHPLGRAEWIKLMGLLVGKEKEADSVFHAIEAAYLQTRDLVSSVGIRPRVMSGIMYGDAWFLPGGQNYAAKILQDAGCDYLWASDSSHGYLQLSLEAVYDKAANADLWIGVADMKSMKQLGDANNYYTRFKPFREQQVYSYDKRKGEKGGSEYLETGYLRPDLILKDLVRIAHPELMPEHQLYFHAKLE